jgi:hypothetical protein
VAGNGLDVVNSDATESMAADSAFKRREQNAAYDEKQAV